MLIGEVAQQSGISARMLRHYDRVGLVQPSRRTANGYREYTAEDLRRLFHVEGLRSLGLSLRDIADALDGLDFDPAQMVARLIASTRERIAHEQELLRRLGWVAASDPSDTSDVLRTIEMLRGLDAGDPRARQRLALSLTVDGHDAPALAEAVLDEREPNVAGTLDWALARTGETALPTLTQALSSADAERRHRAVAALLKIGTPRAQEALAEHLDHTDPQVSTAAALARGARGHADAIPALVRLVAEGRLDVDAADVLAALAAARDQAARVVAEVGSALAVAEVDARRRLVAALADVPGPQTEAVLTGLQQDPDPGVAHTATYLLHRR